MAKTVTNYAQWYINATRAAAQDAFTKMTTTGIAYWWLWYKPHGLELAVACERPQGFELANPEHVPGDRSVDGITYWIRTFASKLPLLPGD